MKCVCLIGKPNVGKSTIFNKLIKEKKSIIMDEPGVTRDRIYGKVTYNEKTFSVIDTGGLENTTDDFNKDIRMQAELAIDEADLILFVVDGKTGLDTSDYFIRDMLIKSGKEVIVLVNKIDNNKRQENIYEFYELGFPVVMSISGEHNLGFKELLDAITKELSNDLKEEERIPKFCIIGRPNVGKSSLINAILNEERAIVSDIAGTTRDSLDTKFTYDKNEYIVIDTAGLRKKGRIYENVEKFSYLRSMRAIDEADVCCVVISAEDGILEHDKHILGYAIESGKGLVLVVNKWDTISNPDLEIKKWKEKIASEFQFADYLKIVFLSAKTKKRIHTLMPEIISAYENNHKEIKTSLLNDVITEAVSLNAPPSFKGKRLKIYFVSQTGVQPPKFTFQVNNKRLIHFSYERYLENKLRENFDLTGTPIMLQFKTKNED
ncbi:MAG: ribosome biogenesis GTPase Der [Bacilli bacterium]|jgi:GTP-binding protein|nr:ribosome biogenesis GTPase Der [Bacilli bacterium]